MCQCGERQPEALIPHSKPTICAACHPKQPTTCHGTIAPAYLDYNRRDVLATSELATKLLEEYDRQANDICADSPRAGTGGYASA
jgi:hypothetical protein